MRIPELFTKPAPVFSFEFFLPKNFADLELFKKTVRDLKRLEPAFVTMTYGAGGSSRDRSVDVAGLLKNELGVETAAHLTCLTHTRAEIRAILRKIKFFSIENIVALRGDQPKDGQVIPPEKRELPHAKDLVGLIRETNGFAVGVAGYPEVHPEAQSADEDLRHLKAKVDAGADWVITQLFFNNDDYFRFVERARGTGITIPILPGIMPVTGAAQTKRFTKMCGARLPAGMLEKLDAVSADKEAVASYGIEYAARQCRELLEKGAPGIHFYTLNKSKATATILARLRKG